MGDDVFIHPSAHVERGAKLGTGVKIGAFCFIGENAQLHDNVVVHPQAHIAGTVSIGEGSQIYPFAALGLAPQDFKFKGECTKLVIGERCIIREHVTMHPGTESGNGITSVGDDGYFMVGSHIAHDCIVGNNVVFANAVAIGGFVQIGDHANLSGHVGVHQFTRIGHHAFIGALAYVSRDVIPYGMAVGNPAALNGLNVIGMQRAGMARAQIRRARSAYRALFCKGPTLFADRLCDVDQAFADCQPAVDFIHFAKQKSLRALCMPNE